MSKSLKRSETARLVDEVASFIESGGARLDLRLPKGARPIVARKLADRIGAEALHVVTPNAQKVGLYRGMGLGASVVSERDGERLEPPEGTKVLFVADDGGMGKAHWRNLPGDPPLAVDVGVPGS